MCLKSGNMERVKDLKLFNKTFKSYKIYNLINLQEQDGVFYR